MDGFEDTEDYNLLDFTIKGIEAGNPEVVNAVLESNFSSIYVNSQPSNEEIQINSELPSADLGFDMADVASNNQRALNSSLSHGSEGYENGEQTTRIPIFDCKISNSNYDMSMQMNVPRGLDIQAACLNQENSHGFDMSSGSTIHPVPNDIVTAHTIHAHDRKMYVSDNRMIRANIQPQTMEQGAMNSVSAMDTSATASEMAFDNSRLAGKYHGISNTKEPHSHNQGLQVLCNLSETIGENAVSNVNILQSPQNETTHSEYSRESKEICLVDDTLAFPGPSGIQQNKNASNFSGESLKRSPQSKMHSYGKGMVIYGVGKKETTEPGVAYPEKLLYVCFCCRFETEEKETIQSHIKAYPPLHFYCCVCREVYTDFDSHDCERKCKVCGKTFLCKSQLERHSADH